MSKLDSYYCLNKVAGVHIHLAGDGLQIHVCQVEASGNQLDITKKLTDLTSVAQLTEHLPAKSIVSLNLSGKGVLQKKVDKMETIDQNAFGKILRDAKIEDYYVQNFVSGEYSFVSVIRKPDADKWISQLQELSFEPLLLSLGVFPAEHVIPQLNVYEQDIFLVGYQIDRDKTGEWLEVKQAKNPSPFAFKLGNEKIDEKLLIPYAAAFGLVMIDRIDPISTEAESLNKELDAKRSVQKFKVNGALVLMTIFMLLLANFILLSWLNSANAALSEQVGNFAATSNNEQEIAERVKEKEALLHTLGWDGGINKSVLIDQVSSLLPPEIKLREIAVNPVNVAESRLQKNTVFYDRRMAISGNSEKIIPVNEWIARIKTRPWVKNIQLENFAFNNELNTGQFTISIDY